MVIELVLAALVGALDPTAGLQAREHAPARARSLPRYALDVRVDLAAMQLEGEARIELPAPRPAGPVVLRLYPNAWIKRGAPPLRLRSAEVDGAAARVEPASRTSARVHAPAAARALTVRWSASIPRVPRQEALSLETLLGALGGGSDDDGLGYGLFGATGATVALAGFYPALADVRGGRWDDAEPSPIGDSGSNHLCDVQLRLEVAGGAAFAVTPGVEAPTASTPGGAATAVTLRQAGSVRDFPLFLLRDHVALEAEVAGVRVRAWARPAHRGESGRALGFAKSALFALERRFGPYPYLGLEIVELPMRGGAGGAEFPGLIVVADTLYAPPDLGPLGALFGDAGGGAGAELGDMMRDLLEFTVAHEVAHQWWAMLVGSDARRAPFVDEPLTSYSAALAIGDARGEAAGRAALDRNARAGYQMARLIGTADGAVRRPVTAFASKNAYGALVYGKAPMLFSHLEKRMGPGPLARALRGYADAHRFREAPPEALFEALEKAAPEPAAARAIMRRFLDERRGDADLGKASMAELVQRFVPGLDLGPMAPVLEQLMSGGELDLGALQGLPPTPRRRRSSPRSR